MSIRSEKPRVVVVVGAGPAGLTAASDLAKAGCQSIVLEMDSDVGGISKTVVYNGYRFDIGGHRFFTKVQAVEDMWNEYLQNDFLERDRLSRILYNGNYFHYPLRISNALAGLGVVSSVKICASYVRARLFPTKNVRSLEDFVLNRFGWKLYSIFFKSYTEKVWGMPCSEISADWAAQRIKGLSLRAAIKNALFGEWASTKQEKVKSLIDKFHYPRLGPGMMWERVAEAVTKRGAEIRLNTTVTRIILDGDRVSAVETKDNNDKNEIVEGSDFISSMPIRNLIATMSPPPPAYVIDAANSLKYRDFITVALMYNKEHLFPDNWIYIHDESVRVGRVQNYKNWSPEMVPDQAKTCLGLEYFCFEGDGLWNMSDKDLIELGKSEMESLGIIDSSIAVDGAVIRMPKAYPVYDETYSDSLLIIREFLDDNVKNLQLVGRNGMHHYNNQDHSMLTAMLAVENILGSNHDLWSVNVENKYHEEISKDEIGDSNYVKSLSSTQPRVPKKLSNST